MRIAHVTPTYWPEVRRGSERFVHDLSSVQRERGHEVTVLTTHAGASSDTEEDGVRIVRRRRPPELSPLRFYEYHLASVPGLVIALRRGDFDVVHAHFPTTALAASLVRRAGGPPFVFTLHGLPTRRYLVSRRYRLELLERVVGAAAECTVWSEAAARPFRRYLGREPLVIPPGIFSADFAGDAERSAEPTLVCAASLGDPRKRAGLLFEAFGRLRSERPAARLRLFESRDPVMSGAVPELPPGVETLAVSEDPEALVAGYATSWASVLPAAEEAFGIVLTESLAAGTPIVADRSGAAPEILAGDDAIGRLFESGDAGDLARVLGEALQLGADPATAARCRARAADYDWSLLGGEWEGLYEGALRRA